MTVIGFGWYNFHKLRSAANIRSEPAASSYRVLPVSESAVAESADDESADADQSAEVTTAISVLSAVRSCAHRTPRLLSSSLSLNAVAYVASGIFQPLFIVEMNFSGVGRQLGLLYLLPYYVGMSLVLPFSSAPRRFALPEASQWKKLVTITAVDFASQACLMAGITRTGPGLFIVCYASGPIWTALFAYVLLQRRVGTSQQLALLLVAAGLAAAAAGSLGWRRSGGETIASAALAHVDEETLVGLGAVLAGTVLHALVYVLQELTLVREAAPLEPPRLCGWIGLMGTAIVCSHAAIFTLPRRHALARIVADYLAASPGRDMPRVVASCYGGKTATDFVHGWAYFHLMGQLGATSMSVMKAAVAASSFAASVYFFCNAACCVAAEVPHGASCPSEATTTSASSFFCHYSAVHCFAWEKGASLIMVLAGVYLYARSARFGQEAVGGGLVGTVGCDAANSPCSVSQRHRCVGTDVALAAGRWLQR